MINELIWSIMEGLFSLTQAINFPSYALALIILTIIIKLVLYPLNKKQMQSSREMQKIQPKMMALKTKYQNNPQKLNEEVMKLYREHNINPMAGCLPILVQMPILILLYNGIRSFVPEVSGAFSFFWVKDLTQIAAGSNLIWAEGTLMNQIGGWIFPVLMGVFTFLQSYVTTGIPKDPTSKMLIYGMPLMMLWWGRMFPGGLCLYWTVFSIVSMLQQIIVNREKKVAVANADIDIIDSDTGNNDKQKQDQKKKK